MNVNKLIISFLGLSLIVMTLLSALLGIELNNRNSEQSALMDEKTNSEKVIIELKKKVVEQEIKTKLVLKTTPTPTPTKELKLPSRNLLNDYDINRPSGRTAEETNLLLKGTNLANLGESILLAEKTFNVNAIFIISVAQLESGYGTSYLARKKNNLFGLNAWGNSLSEIRRRAYSYKTKGDCIQSFAEIIRTKYLDKKRTTIGSIGEIYCEKSDYWVNKITILMGQNIKKLNELKEIK